MYKSELKISPVCIERFAPAIEEIRKLQNENEKGKTLLIGSVSSVVIEDGDSYYAFKKQMDLFVRYLRTGVEPVAFEDTVELMKLVIGGIQSREQGGRKILLSEIRER